MKFLMDGIPDEPSEISVVSAATRQELDNTVAIWGKNGFHPQYYTVNDQTLVAVLVRGPRVSKEKMLEVIEEIQKIIRGSEGCRKLMDEYIADKVSEYTMSYSYTIEEHVETVNKMIALDWQPCALHIISRTEAAAPLYFYQEYIKRPYGRVKIADWF